jgi:hypothetical protein
VEKLRNDRFVMSILPLTLLRYVPEGREMTEYAGGTRDSRKERGSRGRPGRKRTETTETDSKDMNWVHLRIGMTDGHC